MSSELMKSVSGIRGIVGETMTPALILNVARAFALYVRGGKVVIGRDGRCTGHAISAIIESTLALYGCDVVDLGVVPTPTVQIMVEDLEAAGGIIISASHNPIEWNAFKLLKSDGTFLNGREIEKFFALLEKDAGSPKVWDEIGQVYTTDNAFTTHIRRVVNVISVSAIKRKRFKVALDSVNASGSYITTELLNYLNCKIVPVFCEITGTFPRVAEPQPQNLVDLSTAVLRYKCDIGFAQDPDADRLALVDETGTPLSEEYTLVLVAEHLLSQVKGRVVINLSTTKAVEDVAAKYGVECVRTAVGEINVVDEMKNGARIGGEGNGGVISPEIHLGRDSLAGIGYILDMMAQRNKSLSELLEDLPRYYMRKGKVSFNRAKLKSLYAKIKKTFKDQKISEVDGIRIDFITIEKFSNGWVHLRPSNTEPIFRIITEADTVEKSDLIYNYCARLVKSL
ncbi:MAG: phosphoglucosamine mutase [Spirochaetes bacterium]|jgi:phosphomannomutase|nr:phosphoglucosamine mutase [Spirochaetota bacterium]